MCPANEEVQRRCPASCGMCTTQSYYGYTLPVIHYNPVPQCVDLSDGCAKFKGAGWCDFESHTDEARVMRSYCQASCGTCKK